MTSASRIQLEEYLKDQAVAVNAVLDVGGAQKPVRGRLGSFHAAVYHILDLPNPHGNAAPVDIVCDLNDEQVQPTGWEKPRYDLIYCLEVAEYLWNPVHAFRVLRGMAHPGTRLVASFHLVYPVHSPASDDSLRYTPNGAERILRAAGWVVTKVIPRLGVLGSLERCYSENGMRPAKEVPQHNASGFIIEAEAVGP